MVDSHYVWVQALVCSHNFLWPTKKCFLDWLLDTFLICSISYRRWSTLNDGFFAKRQKAGFCNGVCRSPGACWRQVYYVHEGTNITKSKKNIMANSRKQAIIYFIEEFVSKFYCPSYPMSETFQNQKINKLHLYNWVCKSVKHSIWSRHRISFYMHPKV